jgi:hypothetical protein
MKRLIPVLLCVILSVSCSPPLFDLLLSQGTEATKSMTRDNLSAISVSWDSYQDGDGFAFYPNVMQSGTDSVFTYSSGGFLVFTTGGSVNVRGVGPGTGMRSLYGGWSQWTAGADSHMPAFAAWPVRNPSPSSSCLLVIVPTANACQFIMGDPAAQSFSGTVNNLSLTPGLSGNTVLGASFTAQAGSIMDQTHWLTIGGSGYIEVSCMLSSGALGTATVLHSSVTSPYQLSFLPSGATSFQYFYDIAAIRSYASWWDTASGGWKCAAWLDNAGAIQSASLPIDHRIDALLSTGELFSAEGGTGRLYQGDGTLVATFPLGNLVYIGEQYVGGVARAYFSQALRYDDALHFNIYWIQSDKLKDIGR